MYLRDTLDKVLEVRANSSHARKLLSVGKEQIYFNVLRQHLEVHVRMTEALGQSSTGTGDSSHTIGNVDFYYNERHSTRMSHQTQQFLTSFRNLDSLRSRDGFHSLQQAG